jgi:flavin reductase (DIM6/NTAB) family NADH-FMN oxidoreductase RutF
MSKQKTHFAAHYEAVMGAMADRGLLLGSYDAAGKANVMTIGWGMIGSVWGVPTWAVLVRPSRYTYRCIEHTGCFTVNVPGEDLAMACATCGSRSGAGVDKFPAAGLTPQKAATVLAPAVAECPITYECQVVHSNDVLPAKLADEILAGAYVDGDFHRVYWGKILLARSAPDAAERLSGE